MNNIKPFRADRFIFLLYYNVNHPAAQTGSRYKAGRKITKINEYKVYIFLAVNYSGCLFCGSS